VTDFAGVIRTLADSDVQFILVGGVAATVHGSVRLTRDIDIVYARTGDNIERLVDALAPHAPYLRGAPPGLPFQWERDTLLRGLNFTLTTRLGDLDLFGDLTGGGGFVELRSHASAIRIFDRDVLCLDIEWLIRVKRAAGRPKDLEAVAELEALLDEMNRSD